MNMNTLAAKILRTLSLWDVKTTRNGVNVVVSQKTKKCYYAETALIIGTIAFILFGIGIAYACGSVGEMIGDRTFSYGKEILIRLGILIFGILCIIGAWQLIKIFDFVPGWNKED